MTFQRSASTAVLGGVRGTALLTSKVLAVVAAAVLVVGVVVFARNEQTTAVDADVGAVWLSAESAGRIVLVAPRAGRPSLATELVDGEAAYDLADLGGRLVVHDRVEGGIILFDAASGIELDRFDGPVTTDPRPALAAAGDRAYLVDADRNEIRVLTEDSLSDALALDFAPTDWAAGADGLLWLLDGGGRRLVRFDGSRFEVVAQGLNGDEFELTVFDSEPALYEVSTGRLRWLRAATNFAVPGAADGGVVALIAQPDASSGCLPVLTPTRLSCHTRQGVVSDVAFAQPVPTDGMVGGDERVVVVAEAGSSELMVIDAATGAVTSAVRRAPSGRPPIVRIAAGVAVVDDPGSRYAYTVPSPTAGLVETDKLSRRTVVINAGGGLVESGLGNIDTDAEVTAAIDVDAGDAPTDDDGRDEQPVPRPDRAVTRTGREISIDVLANDVDPDGDALAVIAVDSLSPADGTASVLGGTRVRYEPPAESPNRTITFEYQVADPGGLVAAAAVTVELIGDGSNRVPVAADDAIQTRPGSPVTVPVLGNDLDADGDTLTVVLVEGAAHGTTAVDGGVQVRYEPNPGFVGEDTFEYEVSDGFGGSARASVVVTVANRSADNRPPTAVEDRVVVQAGIPFRVDPLVNDSDPDGDRITLERVTPLANVQVDIEDSTLRLVAKPNVSGLVVFSYTIADESGAEATARVVVFVEQPSQGKPPVAIDDRTTTTVDTTIDVVANDISPDGSQLVVDSFTQPASGSVAPVSPTALRYTPPVGFTGTAVFTYNVLSPTGLADTGTVTVEVVPPSNSGPVAVDDTVVVYPGQWAEVRALANDRHPEGLPIAYSGLPSVSVGSARILGNGSIRFQPPNDELTTYVMGYRIRDSLGRTASATITIRVVPLPAVNLLPITANDVEVVAPGGVVDIPVLDNDRDPENGRLALVSVAVPNRGSAVVIGNVVRYTAPDDAGGVVQFSYTVADEKGGRAAGSVSILISQRPKLPPLPAPDLVTLVAGDTDTVPVLANDVDPDGSNSDLSIASVGSVSPAGGAGASVSGSSVRVTAGDTPGTYQVQYSVVDKDGQRASSTLTIVVSDLPNRPPVAVDDALSTVALPFSRDVVGNDIDLDGGTLRLVGIGGVSPAAAGRASVDGNRVAFEPDPSFSGTIVIVYTVADDMGLTDEGTLTVTMSACPTVPSISNLSASTTIDTPVDVRVFPAPIAGVTLSVGVPSSGSASVVGGTTLRYTPAVRGSATIGFTVTSSCSVSRSATLTVTSNSRPVATDDDASTSRNRSVGVSVLANDLDPDPNDTLRVTSVSAGTGGTPSLSAGTVTFTPARDFVGIARFTYTIEDAAGATDTGNVAVEVGNTAPVAGTDFIPLSESATVIVDAELLLNDDDADGDELTITSIIPSPDGITGTTNGTTARFSIPAVLGPGVYLVAYTITDGIAVVQGNVQITLTPDNLPPVAEDDSEVLDLAEGQSVVARVLSNDFDPDGEQSALEIIGIDGPGEIVNNGRRIRYTHVGDQGATVTITYTVSDGTATDVGTLTIIVVPVPPPTTTVPPDTTVPP